MTLPEDMIQEIARKHGVGYRKDDATMVLVTITNRLIEDTTRELANFHVEQLDKLSERIEEIAIRTEADARRNYAQALNSVLEIARTNAAAIMTDGASRMVKQVHDEMGFVLEGVRADVKDFKESVEVWRRVMVIGAIGMAIVSMANLTILVWSL